MTFSVGHNCCALALLMFLSPLVLQPITCCHFCGVTSSKGIPMAIKHPLRNPYDCPTLNDATLPLIPVPAGPPKLGRGWTFSMKQKTFSPRQLAAVSMASSHLATSCSVSLSKRHIFILPSRRATAAPLLPGSMPIQIISSPYFHLSIETHILSTSLLLYGPFLQQPATLSTPSLWRACPHETND